MNPARLKGEKKQKKKKCPGLSISTTSWTISDCEEEDNYIVSKKRVLLTEKKGKTRGSFRNIPRGWGVLRKN